MGADGSPDILGELLCSAKGMQRMAWPAANSKRRERTQMRRLGCPVSETSCDSSMTTVGRTCIAFCAHSSAFLLTSDVTKIKQPVIAVTQRPMIHK